MKEILRSDNIVELKLKQQVLKDHDFEAVVLDEHSGTLMGGIGGILPRLCVLDEDYDAAVKVLKENERAL